MLIEKKKKNIISQNFKNFIKNFLKKIFLKGYPVVKKILVIILLKIKFYRFVIKCLIIKIQYPLYWRLPLKHVYGLKLLINFTKICEEKKIISFLTCGCLLGAVRQKSFAGRPTDIDVGIIDAKKKNLNNLISKFEKLSNPTSVKKFLHKKKIEKIQFYYDYIIFDINIFFIKNKKFWFNRYEYKTKGNDRNQYIVFNLRDLKKLKKTKVYNENFSIPHNSTQYLKKKYGNTWKTPDKKQFVWR